MNNNNSQPLPMEKIVSVLSYLTCGFVGFLFILIVFFSKLNLRPFLKFHIYQSLFLSLLYAVFVYFFGPLTFFIRPLNHLCNVHIIWNLTISDIFIFGVLAYLCIGVLMNKYSYIPWVSDIIKYHVK